MGIRGAGLARDGDEATGEFQLVGPRAIDDVTTYTLPDDP
jgi:hypothetical protein